MSRPLFSKRILAVFIRGIPGSGKTTLTTLLEQNLGYVQIDPDKLTGSVAEFTIFCNQQIRNNSEFAKLPNVTRKYRFNLHVALKTLNCGSSFIWCQTWSSVTGLNNTKNVIVRSLPQVRLLPVLIELYVDRKTAINRVAHRDGDINDAVKLVNKYSDLFETIKDYKDWNYAKFDAAHTLAHTYQNVFKFLRGFTVVS